MLSGMGGLLTKQHSDILLLDFHRFVSVTANSILMGTLLGLATFLLASYLFTIEHSGEDANPKRSLELLLGSSNILFITAGLSSIMLLVQNNIARALAIAAAIALMRFRIKVSSKSLDSPLLYGVVVGIACGLNEIAIAWCITLCYVAFKLLLMSVIKFGKFQ